MANKPEDDAAAKAAADAAEAQRTADEAAAKTADNAATEAKRQEAEAARQAEAEASKTEEQKERDRIAYELRQTKARAEALEKENQDYKRRAEDERKAKLTEEQRVKEERDEFEKELTKLKAEKLQSEIAAEFKLPPALATRIRGTDEAAMRADAEELSKLVARPAIGRTTDPVKNTNGTAQTFKRSQLRDPKFFKDNEAAIRAAAAAGKITDD